MSSRINLNDNISDRFEFTIGGLNYDFVYPTLEDVEPITDLTREREKFAKEDTPESVEKIAEIDDKLSETLYALVKPVGHDTPIKDTLKKQPYPVVRAFNKMIVEQLSAE